MAENISYLSAKKSSEADHLLLLHMPIVLHISVLSVKATAGHSSHVVRMSVAFLQLMGHIVGVMRSETPLKVLETNGILDDGRTQNVSKSDSLLFAVLA